MMPNLSWASFQLGAIFAAGVGCTYPISLTLCVHRVVTDRGGRTQEKFTVLVLTAGPLRTISVGAVKKTIRRYLVSLMSKMMRATLKMVFFVSSAMKKVHSVVHVGQRQRTLNGWHL